MFYVALMLTLYLLLNGLLMIILPAEWFQMVPGVSDSGGFNAHFIRDIGFAFVLSGFGISWRLLDPIRGRAAAFFAAGFLILHACYHLLETILSNHHDVYLLTEIAGIYLPALIALVTAAIKNISLPHWFQSIGKTLAHSNIEKFANSFQYNADYMHEIAQTDLEAIVRFSLLEDLGDYRKQISTEAWYAAKLVGCISEDCGPCTQLVVTMAEKEGLDKTLLTNLIEGKRELLDSESRLFFDYALAVTTHDVQAETLRLKILNDFGPSAIISAGLAIITAKAYPLLKYATGHGQACVKIRIDGEEKPVNKSFFPTTSFST